MKRTISRLFGNRTQAESAVRELESIGIRDDDLSIIAPHTRAQEDRSFRDPEAGAGGKSDAAEARDTAVGAGEGVAAGGLIGGGAGLLTGLGILAIPGLGPVIAAGWLIPTAIGASAGVLAGGAIGGLFGALKDNGVPEDDANAYAEGVRRGGALVSARVEAADVARVEAVFDRYSGADAASRGEQYRQDDFR